MEKNKTKLSDYFNMYGIMYGFFMIFFAIFIAKIGISSFLLDPITKWHKVFNIGVWFVLISFCVNNFFNSVEESKKNRLKREHINMKHVNMKEKK